MLKRKLKPLIIILSAMFIILSSAVAVNAKEKEEEKFQRAVFVGDDTLENMSRTSDEKERFTWIFGERKGLTWIKFQEKDFMNHLKRGDAVVFSVGLSEVSNTNKANSYVNYFNNLASENERKGLKFYVKSIDPVDESKYGAKVNGKIEAWNAKIKGGLSDQVAYIDTHSMLKPSYKTQSNGYYFDEVTTQRIFDTILKKAGMPTDVELREKEAAKKDLSESAINYWGKDKAGKQVFYDEKGNIVRNTFKDVEGATYYFDKDGHYVTGLHEFESFTAFFNDAGIMIKEGTAKVDDEHYMLFDKDGHQLKDKWHEVNGKKYYVDPDGYVLIGWWTLGTTDYYFTKDGSAASGVMSIDGAFYWFNDDGSARVGWLEEDGEKYYFGEGGKMVTGQKKIAGKYYHFKKDGTMTRGWIKTSEGKFYYDLETGEAVEGRVRIDGKTYFFTKKGQLKHGWVTIDDDKYYYKEDGTIYTGGAKIGKNEYFFSKNGKALSGWREEFGDRRYYDEETYEMVTGWRKIDGKKYYFTKDGLTLKGIHKIDHFYHYFNKDGKTMFAIPVLLINLVLLAILAGIGNILYRRNKEVVDKFILNILDMILDKLDKK